MHPLDDITVYFPGDRQSREDSSEAHYIADFYHRCVVPYKPPHTARITINLRSQAESIPPKNPSYSGSICHFARMCDIDAYFLLSKNERYQFILEIIHDSCLQCARRFDWDQSIFKNARYYVLKCDYRFIKEYPPKVNRRRTHSAQVVLRKNEQFSNVFARTTDLHSGSVQEIQLAQMPNEHWYDPVYFFASSAHWFDSDEFGFYEDIPEGQPFWTTKARGHLRRISFSITKQTVTVIEMSQAQ